MARTCIFCGGPAGSEEHVFPNWLNGVLPALPDGVKADWGYTSTKTDEPLDVRAWSKPQLASEVTKSVCHDCNTGWMASAIAFESTWQTAPRLCVS